MLDLEEMMIANITVAPVNPCRFTRHLKIA